MTQLPTPVKVFLHLLMKRLPVLALSMTSHLQSEIGTGRIAWLIQMMEIGQGQCVAQAKNCLC